MTVFSKIEVSNPTTGSLLTIGSSLNEVFRVSVNYKGGDFRFTVPNERGQFSGLVNIGDTVQYFYDSVSPPVARVFDGFVDKIDFSARAKRGRMVVHGKAFGTRLAGISAQPEVYLNKRSSYIITDLGGKYFTENALIDDFETAAKAGSWIAQASTDAIEPAIGSVASAGSPNIVMEREFAADFKMQTGSSGESTGKWINQTINMGNRPNFSGGKVGGWAYLENRSALSGIRYGIGKDAANMVWADYAFGASGNGWYYPLFNFSNDFFESGTMDWNAIDYQEITLFQEAGASGTIHTWIDDLRMFKHTSMTYSRVNSGTEFTNYKTKHRYIQDVINDLREVESFDWFVNTDRELVYRPENVVASSIGIGSQNLTDVRTKKDNSQLFNRVWVYGDKTLIGWEETFTGDGVGSVFQLEFSPHNSRLFVSGIKQPGGIFEAVSSAPPSGTAYLVEFDERNIIFVSGTEAGDNIPGSLVTILAEYQYEKPILGLAEDLVSISEFGLREKIITSDEIKSPKQAQDIADSQINLFSNPLNNVRCDFQGTGTFVPAEVVQINFPRHGINNQSFKVIDVTYQVNTVNLQSEQIVSLNLAQRVPDVTDYLAQMIRDIKRLQAKDISAEAVQPRFTTINVGSVSTVLRSFTFRQRDPGSGLVLGHNTGTVGRGLLGSAGAGSFQPFLGTGAGYIYETVAADNFENHFKESFGDDTYLSGTFAAWSNTGSVVLTSAQSVLSRPFFLTDGTKTTSSATLKVFDTSGLNLKAAVRTSNGGFQTFGAVGSIINFGTPGSSLEFRISEVSGTTGTTYDMEITYV